MVYPKNHIMSHAIYQNEVVVYKIIYWKQQRVLVLPFPHLNKFPEPSVHSGCAHSHVFISSALMSFTLHCQLETIRFYFTTINAFFFLKSYLSICPYLEGTAPFCFSSLIAFCVLGSESSGFWFTHYFHFIKTGDSWGWSYKLLATHYRPSVSGSFVGLSDSNSNLLVCLEVI